MNNMLGRNSQILTLDTAPEVFASFLIDQRAHVEKDVFYKKYPDFQYTRVLYVDTSAGEWADVVARKMIDGAGKPKWGGDLNNDIPRVDISTAMGSLFIYEKNLGYSYTQAEVIRASQTGIQLDSERAVLTRDLFEFDLNRIALLGDKEKKMHGFYNHEEIPVTNTGVSIKEMLASISVTSGMQEIVSFFSSGIAKVEQDQTNTIYSVSQITLPFRDYKLLNSAIIPGGGTNTILPYLEKNLGVKFVPEILMQYEKSDQFDDIIPMTKDRIMFGGKDKQKARFHLPRKLKYGMPYSPNGGRSWNVDGQIRSGGTEIRIPKAFHYFDMADTPVTSMAKKTTRAKK